MDQKSAGSLSITRSSISRHGLAIADDIVKKVFANLIIGFNGPSVTEFTAQLDIESRQRHWPLYLCPITNNLQ